MATGRRRLAAGDRMQPAAARAVAAAGRTPVDVLPGGAGAWPGRPAAAAAPSHRWRRRIRHATAASMLLGLAALAAARGLDGYLATAMPFVASRSVHDAFVDATPVTASISVPGAQLAWPTTADALLGDITLWRMMHLADWNRVAGPRREAALDAMLERYHEVLVSPSAWDRMKADDWDLVPQPIRTIAFRHMAAYWAGYYHLGAGEGLPPGLMADTLAAVVMSESWFDHRAVGVNRDGTRDIGLAGASEFARARVRELHAAGFVDVGPEDDAYFDPWTATRFAAIWLGLLLHEADGDVDRAIGAYNRGISDAQDATGLAYTAMVHRRRSVFIRNQGAPPAWDYVWRRAREIERQAWPWMRFDRADHTFPGALSTSAATGVRRQASLPRPNRPQPPDPLVSRTSPGSMSAGDEMA